MTGSGGRANSPWAGRTYWLIGASEGLGRALAHELSKAGAMLCLSARDEGRLTELAAELAGDARVAPLDVRDRASVEAAYAALPPLDGIIYCAGAYEPMAAQAWDAQAVEVMCDVNFNGACRALGAAMPDMVARGAGHIVLIGSLAGLGGLPRSIGYGASKAGLIHLGESLRADLPRPAFKVQVINPGFIETRLTEKNDFRMPGIMSPEAAAARTRALMESGRFRGYYPSGFALLFRIGRLLPDWLYFRLLKVMGPR